MVLLLHELLLGLIYSSAKVDCCAIERGEKAQHTEQSEE